MGLLYRGLLATDAVSVTGISACSTVTPALAIATVAPATKFVPVNVTGTLVPCAPLFGLTVVSVGAGPVGAAAGTAFNSQVHFDRGGGIEDFAKQTGNELVERRAFQPEALDAELRRHHQSISILRRRRGQRGRVYAKSPSESGSEAWRSGEKFSALKRCSSASTDPWIRTVPTRATSR